MRTISLIFRPNPSEICLQRQVQDQLPVLCSLLEFLFVFLYEFLFELLFKFLPKFLFEFPSVLLRGPQDPLC